MHQNGNYMTLSNDNTPYLGTAQLPLLGVILHSVLVLYLHPTVNISNLVVVVLETIQATSIQHVHYMLLATENGLLLKKKSEVFAVCIPQTPPQVHTWAVATCSSLSSSVPLI